MVGINQDGTLAPIPRYPDRATARESKQPYYIPATPCHKHPDAAFYTANDRCVVCHNTAPRAS